jgi:hypothetical protein
MDGPSFILALEGTRPITREEVLEPGEVRLSVIQESSVTRVAIPESAVNRVMAYAELNGGRVCRNRDLVSVILPPGRV